MHPRRRMHSYKVSWMHVHDLLTLALPCPIHLHPECMHSCHFCAHIIPFSCRGAPLYQCPVGAETLAPSLCFLHCLHWLRRCGNWSPIYSVNESAESTLSDAKVKEKKTTPYFLQGQYIVQPTGKLPRQELNWPCYDFATHAWTAHEHDSIILVHPLLPLSHPLPSSLSLHPQLIAQFLLTHIPFQSATTWLCRHLTLYECDWLILWAFSAPMGTSRWARLSRLNTLFYSWSLSTCIMVKESNR